MRMYFHQSGWKCVYKDRLENKFTFNDKLRAITRDRFKIGNYLTDNKWS